MSAANSHPDFPVLRWLDDRCKVVESRTYADLLQASRKTAATLIANGAQPGDRAVLCHSQGLEFIAAFYGCLLARVIAGNAALRTTPPSPPHTLSGSFVAYLTKTHLSPPPSLALLPLPLSSLSIFTPHPPFASESLSLSLCSCSPTLSPSLYLSLSAVPLSPPSPAKMEHGMKRIAALMRDCTCKFFLTCKEGKEMTKSEMFRYEGFIQYLAFIGTQHSMNSSTSRQIMQ